MFFTLNFKGTFCEYYYTRDNPELDPLAVLPPDNRLLMLAPILGPTHNWLCSCFYCKIQSLKFNFHPPTTTTTITNLISLPKSNDVKFFNITDSSVLVYISAEFTRETGSHGQSESSLELIEHHAKLLQTNQKFHLTTPIFTSTNLINYFSYIKSKIKIKESKYED